AAEIGEMLDCETQTAWASGSDHQPRTARREMLIADLAAELFVVGLVIVPADALLRHPGGAARFEDAVRLSLVGSRHPDLGLHVAEPFVLEVRELLQVGERLDLLARIPAGL